MKVIYLTLYRILLDISYFEIISPVYSYMGFKDFMSGETLILSWTLFFVSLWFNKFWMNEKNIRVSGEIMSFIYLMSFVPLTTCICAGIISEGCIFWNMVFYFLFFGIYAIVSKLTEIRRMPLLKISRINVGKLCMCFILVILIFHIINYLML